MYKLITVLLFSLMLGFTGSTHSADGKPLSPQKECGAVADLQYRIAQARDSIPAVQLAEVLWKMFGDKKISPGQLATVLTYIIAIYSSPLPAQDIRDQVYDNCMTTTGKNEV